MDIQCMRINAETREQWTRPADHIENSGPGRVNPSAAPRASPSTATRDEDQGTPGARGGGGGRAAQEAAATVGGKAGDEHFDAKILSRHRHRSICFLIHVQAYIISFDVNQKANQSMVMAEICGDIETLRCGSDC